MTREGEIREKEISQAAESEYFITKVEEFAWIHGAEWADQHPRKGLWDAKKVCAWIGNHLLTSHQGYILEDLRKAMEE